MQGECRYGVCVIVSAWLTRSNKPSDNTKTSPQWPQPTEEEDRRDEKKASKSGLLTTVVRVLMP